MNLRDIPIQRKIMNVILLTCAVVLSVMCIAYIILEYVTYRDSLYQQARTMGAVIASNSSAALAFDSPKDATEILSALKAEKNIVAACLYNTEGEIFATYPAQADESIFPAEPTLSDYKFEKDFLMGFEPVMQENTHLGTLFLQYDLKYLYDQILFFTIIGIAMISGSLLIAFILSRILQKTISQPILALEKTARIISEKKDYSVRAQQFGRDEIGALTAAFNQMLLQIQNQNREITSFNQKLEQKVNERTTELQNANTTLKEQKDFVETIINSAVNLIIVYDKHLNFIMINKRAEEYFPLSNKEIVGMNFLEVFPQLKDQQAHTDILRALNGEYVHNSRFKTNISSRYFENFLIPLKNYKNEIYGVLAIAHDITEIMETNEKLEMVNEELIKSNRDLEQFAYVASHDLQEPLRKIQIFTQLLKENVDDIDLILKYQEKINQSAYRMQLLIQDVLDFSRISKSEESFTETDLNQLMEDLKNDFELVIREKGAEIKYPQLPVIIGNPLQLSQLFSNLLSNSLKYNKGKPAIYISYQKVKAGELSNEHNQKLNGTSNYYHFKFTDNGIGFDAQYNEQIFSIFKRLHGKHEYSGTGIGLALCKKIVENHYGVIYAEGEPETGSTFNIILPA
jgi:PAS domain S-box-containing protein